MQTLTEYLTENRVHSAPVIEYVPTGEIYRGVRALYYDLPAKDAAYRIFSYLALPQSPPPQGGYPAVVLLHGGNGMAYYEVARMWAKRGFAAIAPDLNGFCAQSTARRDVPNPNGGPHGYGTNVRGPHPWAYFSVLSAMRAADVLCSLPEVNADKLCSCGLSWGGWLNLLFAAKERRLKAVSIIYSSAYAWQSGWGAVQTASLSPKNGSALNRQIRSPVSRRSRRPSFLRQEQMTRPFPWKTGAAPLRLSACPPFTPCARVFRTPISTVLKSRSRLCFAAASSAAAFLPACRRSAGTGKFPSAAPAAATRSLSSVLARILPFFPLPTGMNSR